MKINKIRSLAAAAALTALIGCGGGGGGSSEPKMCTATANLNASLITRPQLHDAVVGTWEVKEDVMSNNCPGEASTSFAQHVLVVTEVQEITGGYQLAILMDGVTPLQGTVEGYEAGSSDGNLTASGTIYITGTFPDSVNGKTATIENCALVLKCAAEEICQAQGAMTWTETE